jgi:uncharacterized protein YkwD
MLAQLRAIRVAGIAALAAMLLLTARASASSTEPAAIGSATSAVETGVLSVASISHTIKLSGHIAEACPNAGTAAASAPRQAIQDAVECLVNREREAHGLPPLHASAELSRSAQGWSDEMVARRFFSHGSDFAARISAAGYRWSAAAENIATGQPTPWAVVRAWMASPGHCQNILNPTYRDLGVGVDGRPVAGVASGPATWTEDLGLRMFQSAPSGNWGPAEGCPYR